MTGDGSTLGNNKILILYNYHQIIWKENILSRFRTDVASLEFLKS